MKEETFNNNSNADVRNLIGFIDLSFRVKKLMPQIYKSKKMSFNKKKILYLLNFE